MITYQCLRGSESSFFSFCRRSEIKYAKENPEENHSSLLTTKIDKTSRSEGLFILNSVSIRRLLSYVGIQGGTLPKMLCDIIIAVQFGCTANRSSKQPNGKNADVHAVQLHYDDVLLAVPIIYFIFVSKTIQNTC